jgi:putative transcriptional regulator
MSKMKREKHPSILEAAHETAQGLYDANVIDATTMREFDELCLPKIKELSPRQIKNIRLRQGVSQPVFAKFLNTTLSTVRQWEQGVKHPRGTSLKLLNLIAEKGLEILLSGGCSHYKKGVSV